MSALIRVLASKQSVQLRPGEQTDLILTVQNFGEVVDRYHVSVEGIDPSWVTVSRRELSLFPKDQDELRITLHPVKGPGIRAGYHDVRIQVTSQDHPEERSTVTVALQVNATAAFELMLYPQEPSGEAKGLFIVQASNRGDIDLNMQFEADDREQACRYSFDPAEVVVPAGQKHSLELTVRPKARLTDKEAKTYPFTITARLAEAPETIRQVQGEWKQLPRKRRAGRILAIVVVLLLVVVAGLAFLWGWSQGWWFAQPPSATPATYTPLPTYTVPPTYTAPPTATPRPMNTLNPGQIQTPTP